MYKKIVTRKLQKYVKKYFEAHPEVKLIAVAGSVGKTSTKHAIGTILSQRFRVRMHDGNHNTNISAPMAILGLEIPEKIHSITAWLGVFRAAKARIKNPPEAEIIVQEIGIDRPGEMADFARYLHPHISLVTAVTPEHMANFTSIDTVAREELSISAFSDMVLINRDDIEGRFAQYEDNPNMFTYGTTAAAEYKLEVTDITEAGTMNAQMMIAGIPEPIQVRTHVLGEHSLRPIAGAVAVAAKLNMTGDAIKAGVQKIQPVPGRMNPLKGLDGSIIIDDTYNSSPAAATAALQTLYQFAERPQRIVIFGSMNELGMFSQEEHEKLGKMCSADMLDWVIVVGDEAANYLAPAAKQQGNQVKVCRDAIEAGEFARSVMKQGAVVLVKGSQGGIYLEEASKMLCDNSEEMKLVRQSPRWMKVKNEHFSRFKDKK